MELKQRWHVVGLKYNREFNKDEFVDCVVKDCITVDDAIKRARETGVYKVTGAFLHSSLISK